MVKDLLKRRLIAEGYTTHPLIKGYFEFIFDEKEKKSCHKAIYEYFGRIAKDKPETLEEMQPLFEQVYHGCSAGLYDEVDKNVYRDKIGGEPCGYKITQKLGAEGINLSLVRNFFPNEDLSQMPLVSEKRDQSWLLNEAGLALLNIGRPKEAEEPFLTAIKMDIKDTGGKNASVGYQNLAGLQFRTGRLEEGLSSAQKALELAEKAKFEQYISISKAYLAWILYLMGKFEGLKSKPWLYENTPFEGHVRFIDQNWKKVTAHYLDPRIPSTNNASENFAGFFRRHQYGKGLRSKEK
ncbi:MAG: tetratricopeptide repeat protein, partial [bacterium]